MIRYFIPSDGDDPDHPNVFQLPSGVVGTGMVHFGDVKRNFPLPGQYHFRFKKKFGDAFVWVDMTEAGAMVPSCEGSFTAKITRLSDPAAGSGAGNPTARGVEMAPPSYESSRQRVNIRGVGMGSDDLLNMGHGPAASHPGAIPGPGSIGNSSQPDLLNMGMFDSSPTTGVSPPAQASVGPAGVGVASPLPRSPLMHPTPMHGGIQGAVGGPGGGFRQPGSMGQWQQQQHHQHHPQQQFARFPSQGRGSL